MDAIEDNTLVMGLYVDGYVDNSNCIYARSTRPAFIISYEYFENNKKGLSQYSDAELIDELYKRHSNV